jgi:phage shock protein C
MNQSTYSSRTEEPGKDDEGTAADAFYVPHDEGARRQLRRSKENRVIGGVCGGLGRYFGIDPILFRIGFLALLIPGGFGLLLYIISWIAIPEFRTVQDESHDSLRTPVSQRVSGMLVGGALVLIGLMILMQRFIDWFDPRIMGGAALIIIGAFIVFRGLQSEERT